MKVDMPLNKETEPKLKDLYVVFELFQFSDNFIGLIDRVFTNGPGDLGSIPCRVI